MTARCAVTIFPFNLRTMALPWAARDDVAGWDSFNYVNFIAAVEIELGVKFRVADVESFENVGAIVNQTKKMLG